MKARRLAGRLCERAHRVSGRVSDAVAAARRQVFYEEVMTALGYAKNAAPFRRVAERVPLEALPRETAAAQTAFRVAGSFETWERTGLRPWNAPESRLAHAAESFTETPVMELCDVRDFSRPACRQMVAALCGARQRGEGGLREHCMGRGRAAAILANVVAPFALAEDRMDDVPDWLPPEDVSEPVRLTAFRLFGRDHNPAAFYSDNGLLIQGLLQIHRDHCLRHHPDCAVCGLGTARPRLPKRG